ncbi:phosphoglycerate mutase family protein [Wielerella bovis]|uniref:histidine phosphatase family protein n=1 Tax=Wielerella bovis TaxID=2917790 RepID=UPI0020183FA6|nr:histidine phosphatase family protein [Wielerella bovis]ULJ62942.1 phosphoglycerate mutase family protein [Wielerella bovis]
MKTIYLIRHAQSLANAGGISLPERDIPLSDLGKQQAAELVFRLPESENVFVSEMRRTHETAAPYCQHYGIAPIVLPSLNEFSCLSLDLIRGMNGEQRRPLALAYWQRADVNECTGQGADTFSAFNQRVDDFLADFFRLPENSLLFGHGIWLALLAWKVLGFQAATSDDMRRFRAFQQALPMANASVWRLSGNGVNNWCFQAAS